MLNIGATEIIFIAVIALVVLGPEKFPTFAKMAIRAFRDFKSYFSDLQRDVTRELNPLKKEFGDLARHRPEDLLDRLTGPATKELKEAIDLAKSDTPATATPEVAPETTASTEPIAEPEATGANEPPAEQVAGTIPAANQSGRTNYGDYSD